MTTSQVPGVEETVQRVKEASDKLLELTKRNGLAWLQAYEKVLDSMLRLEQEAAEGTKAEWITTLATTHADFVREMSQAYLGTIRNQLR